MKLFGINLNDKKKGIEKNQQNKLKRKKARKVSSSDKKNNKKFTIKKLLPD